MNDAVTGPPPGTRPKRNPNPLPRSMGRHEARQSANVGHKPRMRSATSVLLTILSTLFNTSVTPNSPMTTARSSMPAERSIDPKVKRSRPVDGAEPTRGGEKPERPHKRALPRRAGDHEKGANDAEPHRGKILRRSETNGDRRDRRRKERHHDHAECAGDERADRRDPQGRAGAPLLRHLVTVETGHDRRGLAWDVEKDRGRRAAIHSAAQDRAEHHHSADRRHGERDRQQQGERRERAHAREHAHQRPDQAAEKAEKKIIECQDDAETGEQPPDGLHASPTPRTSRQ